MMPKSFGYKSMSGKVAKGRIMDKNKKLANRYIASAKRKSRRARRK